MRGFTFFDSVAENISSTVVKWHIPRQTHGSLVECTLIDVGARSGASKDSDSDLSGIDTTDILGANTIVTSIQSGSFLDVNPALASFRYNSDVLSLNKVLSVLSPSSLRDGSSLEMNHEFQAVASANGDGIFILSIDQNVRGFDLILRSNRL